MLKQSVATLGMVHLSYMFPTLCIIKALLILVGDVIRILINVQIFLKPQRRYSFLKP